MDVLPLPASPHLEQYRKRAKELVAAVRSGDEQAVRAWAAEWQSAIARLSNTPATPFVQGSIDRALGEMESQARARQAAFSAEERKFPLTYAQFLIARAHGFENWAGFSTHLARLTGTGVGQAFEAAAEAMVTGDLAALSDLLRRHPRLIRARSARLHRATLLHYVAANGVEDFRQRTPSNAVAVARRLLEAGAEVDALADTYGGGTAQTTLNLLVSSEHPAKVGLQSALVEVLLEAGAAVDGLEGDGSPLMTALAFGYGEAAETLVGRGAKIENVVAAAALGRDDLVGEFVVDGETLAAGVPLLATRWPHLPRVAKANIDLAFVWACSFGRASVVEVLLEKGVDPGVADVDAMTGLHWAAAHRHLEVVQLLLRHGAPLEGKNRWGGTVLDSTVFFARGNPSESGEYVPVIEALLAAGAEVGAVGPLPVGIEALDAVLRRYGAQDG